MTESIIIAVVVIAIVGLASFYVYKAKKSGKKCIGCPDSGCSCHADKKEGASPCSGCCGCGNAEKK